MFAKLFILGTLIAIGTIGIVASFDGFSRGVLESGVMDMTVGGLMVAGILATVGLYFAGGKVSR